MNELEQLLGSRTRSGILACLFGTQAKRMHLRALVRKCGVSIGAVQQDIKKLVATGLVISERDGNRLYYSGNTRHPLYAVLQDLVQRTVGIYGALQEALKREDILYAYVFGSIASGEAKEHSDVDLMIIGTVSLRELSVPLSAIVNNVEREVNPYVMTLEAYLDRCLSGEHFITSTIGTMRQMIIGDKDELERLETEWMAKRTPHVATGNR